RCRLAHVLGKRDHHRCGRPRGASPRLGDAVHIVRHVVRPGGEQGAAVRTVYTPFRTSQKHPCNGQRGGYRWSFSHPKAAGRTVNRHLVPAAPPPTGKREVCLSAETLAVFGPRWLLSSLERASGRKDPGARALVSIQWAHA